MAQIPGQSLFGDSVSARLGLIVHPDLGPDATIHVNFRLETNDWKNVWIPPLNTKFFGDMLLYNKASSGLWKLRRPDLEGEDPERPIVAGTHRCFQVELERGSKDRKKGAHKEALYLRPILFPTKNTLKKWKERKLQFDDPCTFGLTLTTETALKSIQHIGPGLMEFHPMQILDAAEPEPPDSMSFCLRLIVPGEYHVFWEIGGQSWFQKNVHLTQFHKFTMIGDIAFGFGDATTKTQQRTLDKLDEMGCRQNEEGFYAQWGHQQFAESSFLKVSPPQMPSAKMIK